MSDLLWAALVIAACGGVIAMIFIWVLLADAKRDIDWLNRELNYKASDAMASMDRTARYKLERKVDAITRHLNITIEEEPAKLVVRKGASHE